ncbi:MAG: hypothetical protein KBS35_02050 [Mycoplasma sp.]|nr:hypothetical protein [Candidatus Hennigella equi]
MKITRKLIGYLSAATIATTSVTAIAACSFIRRPEGKYEIPNITFTGESTTIDQGESQTNGSLSFEFDRELYDNEVVQVDIVTLTERNADFTLAVNELHYKAGNNKLLVDIEADIPVEKKYQNLQQKFKLKFTFVYGGESYDAGEWPDEFTFKYTAPWEQNTVVSTYATPYVTDNGLKTFHSDDFKLIRPLRTSEDYNETLRIESLNPNIAVDTFTFGEDGMQMHIDLHIADCDDYQDFTQNFSLKFVFGFRNNPERGSWTSNELTVNYGRIWEENKLNFINDSGDRIFTTAPGQKTVSSDENEFYLDRALKNTEPTKYGETLDLSITNAEFGTTGYTSNDFHINHIVSDTSVVVSLTLDVKQGDLRKNDIKVTNITIHWRIYDDKFTDVPEASGDFTGLTFVYQPTIDENNSVIAYGYDAATNNIEPADGVNGTTLISSDGTEVSEKGFYFARLLEPDVDVTIEPIYETTPATHPIKIFGLNYTYSGSGAERVQYLNFSVEFESITDLNTTQNQEFKLKFTFSKNGDSYSQELNNNFNLIFTPKTIAETDHVPRLESSYAGENHGDVILHVVGKLDKPLKVTDNELEAYQITIKNQDKKIEFMQGTAPYDDGYEIIQNEAEEGKPYNVVDMYVRIVDPDLKHFEGKIYNTEFDFEFDHSGNYEIANTNIVYEEYSNKTDVYIRSRTIPINLKYKQITSTGTSYNRVFTTTWVLAKAPEPDPENPGSEWINPDGYCYYLATTRSFKEKFDDWVDQYSTKDEFSFGITDYSFAGDYQYYKNETKGNTLVNWSASDYRYNYVYCDTNQLKWETDEGQFDYGNGYGADIYVAKVNFKDLMFIKGEEKITNEMIIAYLNKLNTLNNFYKDFGHINDFVTTDLSTLDLRNGYDNFVLGGYPWQQHVVNDEGWDGGTMSRTNYETMTFTPSQLTYFSKDDYRARDKVSNVVEKISGTNLYHGAPVYMVNTSTTRQYKAVNQSNDPYGLGSFFGGMLACRSKTYDTKTGMYPIKVAGIFRDEPVYKHYKGTYFWGEKYDYWEIQSSKYYPCFDVIYELIDDYIEPDPTNK